MDTNIVIFPQSVQKQFAPSYPLKCLRAMLFIKNLSNGVKTIVVGSWLDDKENKKDKFLLMVGQLEKSRELEKRIQIKRGNSNDNLNSLDSDYYMTLGFLGSSQEIKKLTVFMMKEYMKDGYRSLFNRLEGTIN